jgi:hypothetical protein
VLDVQLNDQPVGSTFLNAENATEGLWTIPLLQRALQAGENHLRIGLEMTLPGTDEAERCRLLDDTRLWTVISQESEISVPYAIADPRPNLEFLPYPFGQAAGHSQALFVVPDTLDASLASDVVQLAAAFGAAVQTDHLEANIALAGKAPQETWQDHNLVLLGHPTKNALLQQFNASLPWPFDQDGGTFAPDRGRELGLEPQLGDSATVGLIQLAQSPWNPYRAVLVLTGSTDAGAHLAAQALLNSGQDLSGDLAMAETTPAISDPRIQSIDTRPPLSELPTDPIESDPEDPLALPSISGSDRILLAEYWWK